MKSLPAPRGVIDAAPCLDDQRSDANTGGFGLPDDVAVEMFEAFGWDVPPTDEEIDAMYADAQARQAAEPSIVSAFASGFAYGLIAFRRLG